MTHLDESSTKSRGRRALRAIVREPLVQFALLAAIPFALHGAFARAAEVPREPILIEDTELRREEALYREALRLGLDRGDSIVRRRLVQKMEYLLEGRIEVPEPGDAELARHLAAHRADTADVAKGTVPFATSGSAGFRDPGSVRFDQVFFGGDDAEARAASVLSELGPDADASAVIARGDAFPLGATHGPLAPLAIEARLGRALATGVREAPVGRWTGPIRSEWGAHLVRVQERVEPSDPPLDAIRADVRRAWIAEQRERALADAVDEVVARFPRQEP